MTLPHEIASDAPATGFAARLQAMLPVIETERLRLRAPRIDDFAAYAGIVAGERGRYVLEEQTREAAWYDFTNMVATWLLRGHGMWSVERRADGMLIGFVLIGFEPGDHEPELGYMLTETAEGQGYAGEAAAAARDYAFGRAGLDRLVSTIDHGNTRSQALARRLGGARDAEAEAAHGNRIAVYRYRAEVAA